MPPGNPRLVIPADCILAAYRLGTVGDPDPYFVTMGWRLVANVFPSQSTSDAVIDAFWTAMAANWGASTQWLGGVVRWGAQPGTGPTYDVSRSATGAGTVAQLPPNTSVLVQKRTGLGGRINRGRFYLPGVAEVNVNDVGDLTTAYRDAIQGRVNSWISATTALADIDVPVILHSDFNVLQQPITAPPTPVLSCNVQLRVATQRRRLR